MELINSNRNKFNSEIILIFNPKLNAHVVTKDLLLKLILGLCFNFELQFQNTTTLIIRQNANTNTYGVQRVVYREELLPLELRNVAHALLGH